jgi:hypothetical protein
MVTEALPTDWDLRVPRNQRARRLPATPQQLQHVKAVAGTAAVPDSEVCQIEQTHDLRPDSFRSERTSRNHGRGIP